MNWKDVPSLSALRALEAAARTGSLSAAARELNVTHAAISQHVRALEKHFGTSVLVRDGHRMVATAASEPLIESLSEGFGRIASASRSFAQAGAKRPLRIATTASFATGWLMPRMAEFWTDHPDIEVELLTGHGLVDFRRDEIDVALRYGRGNWRGLLSEPLVSAGFVAVAAPGKYPPSTRLNDILAATWLIHSPDPVDKSWLVGQGIAVEQALFRHHSSGALVLEAAKAGLGIGIVTFGTVEAELRSGRLVEIPHDRSDDVHAYHVVTQPGVHSPLRDTFIRWLKASVST